MGEPLSWLSKLPRIAGHTTFDHTGTLQIAQCNCDMSYFTHRENAPAASNRLRYHGQFFVQDAWRHSMRALLATTDILYTRHEWCPSTQYLQPAFKAGQRNAVKTSSFSFDFGKHSLILGGKQGQMPSQPSLQWFCINDSVTLWASETRK